MMPIRDVVIFPHMMSPFVVGRESSVRALEYALATDKKISAQALKELERQIHRLERGHPESAEAATGVEATLPTFLQSEPVKPPADQDNKQSPLRVRHQPIELPDLVVVASKQRQVGGLGPGRPLGAAEGQTFQNAFDLD